MVIEQAIADGRAVPFPAALELPPGEGKLEIQYTSLRLAAPERLRFRYWMEGFERDWTSAGQRRVAYYTNLPPGQLHVPRGRVRDERAAERDRKQSCAIRLRPHLYETEWFLALCGVLAAAAAWGAYRLHVRNIRRQFAAVLEERNRLAREMHDTLIQGCVGVSTLLEAASHAQDVSPELGHDLLDRARAEVRAAVDEARLAVWNLRHGSSNGDRLVPAVSQLAHRIGLDAGIEMKVDVSGTPVAVGGEIERNLMLLIREALQNAIRHAAPRRLSISCASIPASSTCRSRTTAWASIRRSISRSSRSTTAWSACGSAWSEWAASSTSPARTGQERPCACRSRSAERASDSFQLS